MPDAPEAINEAKSILDLFLYVVHRAENLQKFTAWLMLKKNVLDKRLKEIVSVSSFILHPSTHQISAVKFCPYIYFFHGFPFHLCSFSHFSFFTFFFTNDTRFYI